MQALISGQISTADGEFHPYDFNGTVQGTGPFVGDGGGSPGMNGDLKHFLDSGCTVIVLGNCDPSVAAYVSNFVARRFRAE